MFKYFIALLPLMIDTNANACAAPIVSVSKAIISNCEFYDAKTDAGFVKQLETYGAGYKMNDDFVNTRLEWNTGALVTSRIEGTDKGERLFFNSQDKDACAKFVKESKVELGVKPACPEVPFEAPASHIIEQIKND